MQQTCNYGWHEHDKLIGINSITYFSRGYRQREKWGFEFCAGPPMGGGGMREVCVAVAYLRGGQGGPWPPLKKAWPPPWPPHFEIGQKHQKRRLFLSLRKYLVLQYSHFFYLWNHQLFTPLTLYKGLAMRAGRVLLQEAPQPRHHARAAQCARRRSQNTLTIWLRVLLEPVEKYFVCQTVYYVYQTVYY